MTPFRFEPPPAPWMRLSADVSLPAVAEIVEVCTDDSCDCKTRIVKHLTPEQVEALNQRAHSALVRSNTALVALVVVAVLVWAALCGGFVLLLG